MAGHRFSAGWMLAISAAAAFVVGASAQEGMRAVRGVVTPDNPIWGQDPRPAPAAAGTRPRAARRPRRSGAAPRPYAQVITGAAKTDDGIFKVHRVGDTLYYEIPEGAARQGLPLGHADQADDDRRRLRRPGRGQPRRALGAARATACCSRTSTTASSPIRSNADRAGRRRREQPDDHPRVQRRGVQPGRRSRHRRHAALPDRRAGVLGARRAIGGRGFDATRSFLEKVVSFPREHQRRGHADVHRQRRRGGRRQAADAPAGARRHARQQRHGADATTAWSSCPRSR